MPSSEDAWDEAADLAQQRGCEPDAMCWDTCIDDAYDTIQEQRDMRRDYRLSQ